VLHLLVTYHNENFQGIITTTATMTDDETATATATEVSSLIVLTNDSTTCQDDDDDDDDDDSNANNNNNKKKKFKMGMVAAAASILVFGGTTTTSIFSSAGVNNSNSNNINNNVNAAGVEINMLRTSTYMNMAEATTTTANNVDGCCNVASGSYIDASFAMCYVVNNDQYCWSKNYFDKGGYQQDCYPKGKFGSLWQYSNGMGGKCGTPCTIFDSDSPTC